MVGGFDVRINETVKCVGIGGNFSGNRKREEKIYIEKSVNFC